MTNYIHFLIIASSDFSKQRINTILLSTEVSLYLAFILLDCEDFVLNHQLEGTFEDSKSKISVMWFDEDGLRHVVTDFMELDLLC